MKFIIAFLLLAAAALAAPTVAPELPGSRFALPARPSSPSAPVIFAHSGEAGPDETFLIVGEALTTNVTAFGVSATSPTGQEYKAHVQFLTNGLLAATIPERAADGPFVVRVGNSSPFVLNAPQPWWCVQQGRTARVFGRNLARRPDFARAFVCLAQPGQLGTWAEIVTCEKYSVTFRLPDQLAAGDYEVWLHAGNGGDWGWGGPVKLHIDNAAQPHATPVAPGADLQQAIDQLVTRGGGELQLPAGQFRFRGTLRVPAGVRLRGAGRTATTLQLASDAGSFSVLGDPRPKSTSAAAVWLAGNGAGVSDLTILGDARVNIGIALAATDPVAWITNCVVERVRVADIDGKQAENCAVHLRRVFGSRISDSELWGRAPLFIAGAQQCVLASNRLVSVTRFGGNAEAAILGRCDTIAECIIEHNVIASPPGAEAGGPTARRLLWFSTGHGSVTHNWIAHNGVEALGVAGQARFGGVAGTDQNVGEMILFEGNHRTAYFGPLAGADATSVTLPKTIPATPDNRLGNVKREQLAHDAAGNETPFWPPDVDDGSDEPPVYEYFVTIFAGRGQGQTRRVVKRVGERLLLDQPWTVAPSAGSVVAVGTAFYQNMIVGNETPDGMTGIQLWISCIENVIAGNTIARQRKPGLFLYANGTTLASSMPRTWNRGISPLFWNVAEGNRADECSAGALVTSGDAPNLPVEFPRALGNVLRHNSFLRSRTDGVVLTSRSSAAGVTDTAPSVAGTIVEFNVVRDAQIGYHVATRADATVLRRNHAYFWYPVNNSTNAPVAFQVDNADTTVAIEKNSVEGIHGDRDQRVLELKRGNAVLRLPEK